MKKQLLVLGIAVVLLAVMSSYVGGSTISVENSASQSNPAPPRKNRAATARIAR